MCICLLTDTGVAVILYTESLYRTESTFHHLGCIRIIQVEYACPALFEQKLLAVHVIIKILMLILSDMIRT